MLAKIFTIQKNISGIMNRCTISWVVSVEKSREVMELSEWKFLSILRFNDMARHV